MHNRQPVLEDKNVPLHLICMVHDYVRRSIFHFMLCNFRRSCFLCCGVLVFHRSARHVLDRGCGDESRRIQKLLRLRMELDGHIRFHLFHCILSSSGHRQRIRWKVKQFWKHHQAFKSLPLNGHMGQGDLVPKIIQELRIAVNSPFRSFSSCFSFLRNLCLLGRLLRIDVWHFRSEP